MSKEISPESTSKFQVRTKKFIRKEMVIGFLVSVFATFSGAFLYLEFLSKKGFDQTWKMIEEGSLYAPLLAMAALPNLFIFFIFIKKQQDYRARGVLMASILTALITFVLKFS
ncbi:MAG: hypothetical protein MK076_11290 [Flavobacteriales bacterium]|nr:hypothetical protein [Flavobacteriales bacterium]